MGRDKSYARAGRSVALGAIQVANHFHLVQNAGEALKKLFQSRSCKMPVEEINPTPAAKTAGIESSLTISIPPAYPA